MAEITLDRLAKVYPDGTRAVVGLDMEVADGEFVVFVGPSGCGKTSALRMIAGLEEITEGTVTIGGEVVNELPPKNRDVAMVFQNYALYPHMSVFDNMGFALKMRGFERGEIARRVNDAAKALGLVEVLRKRPRTLSGGQRQRVAMGRAIVREPQAFLMDEPLSNLDAKLRVQMRAEIARIQRSLGTTTIYVTHDQSEAMTLGDRVAVMRRGELQQLDPPQRLYEEPVNLFVAEFIGSPAMNLVEAVLAWENGAARVRFGEHELPLDAETLTRRPGLASYDGRRLALGIRPEDLGDAALEGVPEDRRIPVTIDLREDMGAEVFLHFGVDATAVETEDVKEAQEDDVAQGLRFIARVARESRAREGERIDLSIDTRRLRFFDLETGQAIL
ncbi:ABC transporter ATP-binding protein [Gaiella occulta]|uniref:ABC transporter ATP-binding protein n=1 Tax=Gaiella occulta TaxID=1002870 RepID=UPI000E0A29B4|nr:sn-glycerol-3-phosphate ABC transporter ATP-binding protein UgpC [Gaiella occulta]